jgi:hypothetical protein
MAKKAVTPEPIKFTRIKGDLNGNPRYVCHFLNFITDLDDGTHKYNLAVFRAKQIGGKKYDTKGYGGGIVFQSYNIGELEKDIRNLMAEVTKQLKSGNYV